ncbi:MAG TPA: hypothetical protein VHF69_04200, partial [Candidatus Synoicihabitans sp.]|nr:hypothetical protein [Candidatus Synoicihabitans sp.]
IGTARLGRLIGTGVGLAWLIAGVVETWLPATTPAIVAAALLVAAASVAGPFLSRQEASVSSRPDFRPVVFWWWTVALMGFVVLTVSAREVAFAPAGADAVRSTSAIYEVGLGLAAAAAALAVGWAFDREAWGRAVGVGVVIAIGAAAAHARGLTLPGVNLAAAGCALAVVTLVYLAARSGRSRQAAALFGFAGWGGAWLGTLVGRLDGGAAIAAVSVAIAITVAALVIRARFVRLFGRG